MKLFWGCRFGLDYVSFTTFHLTPTLLLLLVPSRSRLPFIPLSGQSQHMAYCSNCGQWLTSVVVHKLRYTFRSSARYDYLRTVCRPADQIRN